MSSNLGNCGACGAIPKHRDIAVGVGTDDNGDVGFQVICELPWRIKNAKVNELGMPGPVAVILCSDVCEERYGIKVGFWEGE